jgi:hypothetical protein
VYEPVRIASTKEVAGAPLAVNVDDPQVKAAWVAARVSTDAAVGLALGDEALDEPGVVTAPAGRAPMG